MKEAGREREHGGNGNVKSAIEKEWTKMREKQRRSITTKIFQGLRKHGGYHLSPRADNNQVLRHLAQEAGWVIEPDGTTYRSGTTSSSVTNVCPLCGGGRSKRSISTSTSNFLGLAPNCGGINSAKATFPRLITIKDSTLNIGGGTTALNSSVSQPFCGGFGPVRSATTASPSAACPSHRDDTLMAFHTYGAPKKPSTSDVPAFKQDTARDCPSNMGSSARESS